MLKRILLVWFLANFALAGLFALITGHWYLSLPTYLGIAAELGLVILPNLLFPILLLHFAWTKPVTDIRQETGWVRRGWRPILIGVIAFLTYLVLSTMLSHILGPSIPYDRSGEDGSIGGLAGLLALLLLIVFTTFTVIGEETMFRGLIQTQTSHAYGAWAGVLLTSVLFGLRHLPADIYYAGIWNATPSMWLSRQVDLYLGAIIFSLARYLGRSTYASATMHFLIFMLILVQGFLG